MFGRSVKFSKNTWEQLKALKVKRLMKALEKDKWTLDETCKNTYSYINTCDKGHRRVTLHNHPGKTFYNPNLLKHVLNAIGWNEEDLKRLKLIK